MEKMKKLYKYRSGSLEEAIPMMENLVLPMNVLCFDTETTGIKAEENFVTQLSVMKFTVNEDLTVSFGEQKGWLIKPPIPVPKELEDLHIGPTNEQLKDCPSWAEVFPEIDDLFGSDSVLLAHNTPFDLSFMRKMYQTSGREFVFEKAFDSLVIARSLYLSVKNHKLENLLKELGLSKELKAMTKGGKFHDADTDVVGTVLLFQKELQDWPQLMARKKVVPYIGDCFQFKEIMVDGVLTQVGHLATSTRFYTAFGELRYTHVPREWAADFDLGLVDMLRFEKNVLKYTGCERIQDIKKFDPASRKAKENDNNVSLA